MYKYKIHSYNSKKRTQNGVLIGNWFEERVLNELDNNKSTKIRTMINDSKRNF